MSAPAVERHYTIQEIAELWKVSAMTVRRCFEDQPGVLKLSFGRRLAGKGRPHVTLRIPESVLERFYQQRSAGFRLEVQGGRRGVEA